MADMAKKSRFVGFIEGRLRPQAQRTREDFDSDNGAIRSMPDVPGRHSYLADVEKPIAQGVGSTEHSVPEAQPNEDGELLKDEPLQFDEEWYLRRYPDVARAIEEGRGKSGLEHYLAHGRSEGRLPLPPIEE